MSNEQQPPAALATVDVKREGLRITKWSELREMAQIAHGARLASTVAEAAARIKYGTELGLGPMMALCNVVIVEGKPTLSATAIASQIKRAHGYDYRVLEHTEEVCRIEGLRNGAVVGVSTFTLADAEKAGLLGRKSQTWEKYPRNMLFARAIANLARFRMPELFHGSVYSTDEMLDVKEVPAPVAPAPLGGKEEEAAALTPAVQDADFEEVPGEEEQEEATGDALPVVGPAPDTVIKSVRARLTYLKIPENEWPATLGTIFGDDVPTPVSALAEAEAQAVLRALTDSKKWQRGGK